MERSALVLDAAALERKRRAGCRRLDTVLAATAKQQAWRDAQQAKPAEVDEDEAKRQFFNTAMQSAYSAIDAIAAAPRFKFSKHIKPTLCNLDDMYRATLESINGPLVATPQAPRRSPTARGARSGSPQQSCFVTQLAGTGCNSPRGNPRSPLMSVTKQTADFDGADGYVQALRQAQQQGGRQRVASQVPAEELPPDLQHTAGQLQASLDRIRALPTSKSVRAETAASGAWSLKTASAIPSAQNNATRLQPAKEAGTTFVTARSLALGNAGPAFVEFCKQQGELRERQQRRAAALAQAQEPVLRSQSLQEILEPPAKAPPPLNIRSLRHQDALARKPPVSSSIVAQVSTAFDPSALRGEAVDVLLRDKASAALRTASRLQRACRGRQPVPVAAPGEVIAAPAVAPQEPRVCLQDKMRKLQDSLVLPPLPGAALPSSNSATASGSNS